MKIAEIANKRIEKFDYKSNIIFNLRDIDKPNGKDPSKRIRKLLIKRIVY